MKGEVIHCEDGRILRDMGDVISIFIPMEIRRRTGRKEIIPPESKPEKSEPTPLQIALARAYVWQKWIDEGTVSGITEIAAKTGFDASYVSRILKLASLSPAIVERFLLGNEPEELSLEKLRGEIPLLWDEQEKKIPEWLVAAERP